MPCKACINESWSCSVVQQSECKLRDSPAVLATYAAVVCLCTNCDQYNIIIAPYNCQTCFFRYQARSSIVYRVSRSRLNPPWNNPTMCHELMIPCVTIIDIRRRGRTGKSIYSPVYNKVFPIKPFQTDMIIIYNGQLLRLLGTKVTGVYVRVNKPWRSDRNYLVISYPLGNFPSYRLTLITCNWSCTMLYKNSNHTL